MKNKRLAWIGGLVLVLVIFGAACSSNLSNGSSTDSTTSLTSLVKKILDEPEKYVGSEVTIVGYFRGWNLLGEAEGQSPVTRSDWVIKDNSGAMYVQANDQLDGSLSPGSQDDIERIVLVKGIVRLTDSNQPYIEPTSMEILE